MLQNLSNKIETNKEKCPSSLELEAAKFPDPQEPDGKYYIDLPKSKINEIDDKKEGLNSEASLTKETALSH